MKNVIAMTAIGLMAFAVAGTHLNLNAQEAEPAASTDQQEARRTLPFHGKLKEIDREANTVVVGSRTFKLTQETKYLQGSAESAKVGESVGGSYWKAADGTLMVNSIRFGPKAAKTTEDASAE